MKILSTTSRDHTPRPLMFKTGLEHTVLVCMVMAVGGMVVHIFLGQSAWAPLAMLPVSVVPWFYAARTYKKRFGSVLFSQDGKGAERLMHYSLGGGLVWTPLVLWLGLRSVEIDPVVLLVMLPVYYFFSAAQVGGYIVVFGMLVPSNKISG